MSKRQKQPIPPTEPPRPAGGSDEWRIFLAVALPEPVRDLLNEIQNISAVANLPLRLVDPAIAHLTLHFLGQTSPERAELLSMSLPSAVKGRGAFTLRTANQGVFPNERKPRVLWLGLAGETEALVSLHQGLGQSLRKLGFDVGAEPLRPHITVGRVRDGSHPTLPDDIRKVFADADVRRVLGSPVAFEVQEVQLIRSQLEKR